MSFRFKKWPSACLLSAVSVLVLAGCGPSAPSDRPKTVPVTGKVAYQGAPVEGATVSFVPADPKGKGAVGRTDSSGQYKLTTFAPGDGAMPGSYRVAISKTTVKSKLTEEQEKEYMGKGMPIPRPEEKDDLPVKYKKDATSGLTADVKESGNKTFDFDLKD